MQLEARAKVAKPRRGEQYAGIRVCETQPTKQQLTRGLYFIAAKSVPDGFCPASACHSSAGVGSLA
jgi:hypothetical protein